MLRPVDVPPVPEAAAALAWRVHPRGTDEMRVRDALGPLFTDAGEWAKGIFTVGSNTYEADAVESEGLRGEPSLNRPDARALSCGTATLLLALALAGQSVSLSRGSVVTTGHVSLRPRPQAAPVPVVRTVRRGEAQAPVVPPRT